MPDQVIDGATVPAAGEVTPPAATPEPETTPKAGETVPEETDITKIPFEKIDPKKLKGESLKIYKFWQGNFTKTTQDYKSKLDASTKQLDSLKPLLSDPDIQAKIYLIQNGRYPDGYVAKGPAPVKEPEPQLNPEDIADPFVRQLYVDNLALKARLDKVEGQGTEQVTETIKSSAQSFYDSLKPEQQAIWQENFSEIKEIATGLVSTDRSNIPVAEKVKRALSRAYNSAAGGKIDNIRKQTAEETEKKVLAKIQEKKKEVSPETGINAQPVPGKAKTIEEAISMAMSMGGKK